MTKVRTWLVWGGMAGLLAAGMASAQTGGAQTGGSMTGGAGAQTDLPIAVQMYTLRDYGSLEEQLQLAADSGYRYIETVGDHGVTAEEMNTLLDRYGLQVASSHFGLDALQSDLEGVIAFSEAVGNTNVVMPYLGEEDRPQDAAGWQELGAELNDIGAQLQESGMQLAYHNHDFEMAELDGELIIDHILGAAEPENLMWQADVAWIDRGGQDPAQLLSDHAGRVITVHAKDNAPEGENEDEGGWAAVGEGVLNWDEILPAARDAGAQWYIVEHDQPADHAAVIGSSHDFLSSTLPEVLGE
jgi:sugar phosphate isomerase/epimerase